jgi:ribosome-binding protein aMBF1 (putative translation factor)
MKNLAEHMQNAGITVERLATSAGLDKRLVKAIASGNFVPDPSQRQRLAVALGVSTADVSWDHAVPVQHMRGNGSQCGRST